MPRGESMRARRGLSKEETGEGVGNEPYCVIFPWRCFVLKLILMILKVLA